MEDERKKTFALAVLIIIGIVAAIFIFIWGVYLNRGTISITADPPFSITTLEEEILCDVSPCEIVQKRGIKDMVFSKTGHQNISTTVDVKLWSTVDLNLNFVTNPYVEATTGYPEPDPEVEYEIIFDEQKKSYKLIKSGDDQERPIVFFLKEIARSKIFGSESGALIVDLDEDDTAYKINIKNAERDKINGNLKVIETGKWSPNGENFAYTTSDSTLLSVVNQYNDISLTTLVKESTVYAWTFENDLFYITQADQSYYFGIFNPLYNSYTDLYITSELSALPEEVIPSNNLRKIYFKIGEEKFILILE